MKNKPLAVFSSLMIVISCDQNIYDTIYRQIIQEALHQDDTHAVFVRRNTAIETLRHLCHGQLSSYERSAKNQQASLIK